MRHYTSVVPHMYCNLWLLSVSHPLREDETNAESSVYYADQ
jgi:hypothetical protein